MENTGLKLHQRLLIAAMVTLAAARRVKIALRMKIFWQI